MSCRRLLSIPDLFPKYWCIKKWIFRQLLSGSLKILPCFADSCYMRFCIHYLLSESKILLACVLQNTAIADLLSRGAFNKDLRWRRRWCIWCVCLNCHSRSIHSRSCSRCRGYNDIQAKLQTWHDPDAIDGEEKVVQSAEGSDVAVSVVMVKRCLHHRNNCASY